MPVTAAGAVHVLNCFRTSAATRLGIFLFPAAADADADASAGLAGQRHGCHTGRGVGQLLRRVSQTVEGKPQRAERGGARGRP